MNTSKAIFGPKKITASQIHHLLGDSVWRRNKMLQQVLERCDYHMDKGELLIELAADAVNAAAANRIYNFEADGVTPKTNPEVSKIIHRGQHEQFDIFAEGRLIDQYSSRTGGDFGNTNWSSAPCNVMIDVIKATANELRELFLRNALNSNLLSSGVLK